MAKRGRPAHPDILTPREWEVLDLVREGLSNEAIAERLGISVSGVKFHLTEILGKLGLDNRTDAARWQPAEARPWWTAAATPLALGRRLGSGWAAGAIAGALVVAVAVGVAVLVWALLLASDGDGGERVDVPPVDLAGLTAENFPSRFEDGLSREGLVMHTAIEARFGTDTANLRAWTVEAWVDGAADVSREEFRKDPSWDAEISEYVLSVADAESYYSTDGFEHSKSPNDACPGLTQFLASVLNTVLQCVESEGVERRGTSIDLDETYDGIPAVAYIANDANLSEGGPEPFEAETTSTFYVDRESFLPLALVTNYRDLRQGESGTGVYDFDSEFVRADSLPGDFFEPSSIGYAPPTPTPVCDPEAVLDEPDSGVTVYWLGREFAGVDALPPLRLDCSGRGEHPGEGPGYRVDMRYEVDETSADVSIWLWRPEDWQLYNDEALNAMTFTGPCGSQEELSIAGGRAVIYAAHEPEQPARAATPEAITPAGTVVEETPLPYRTPTPASPDITSTPGAGSCPDRPFDLYTAVVYFDDTIVTVNMPHCIFCLGRGEGPDPYDSRAGMEAIVRALQVRD